MNEVIIQIFQVEELAGGSNIAFFVPISLQKPVYACNQYIVPNVKFSVIVEKWLVNIRLNDVSEWLPILMFVTFLYYKVDISESRQTNAFTSVGVFSGLDNPYLLGLVLVLLDKFTISLIFPRAYMIGFRDKVKGISIFHCVIMKEGFKQIFLRTYTIITWKMITYYIWHKDLLKRYQKTIFCDIVFNSFTFFSR